MSLLQASAGTPGSRGESLQATTRRSYGLASQVLRTRRGPRCTIAAKPCGAETDARCRPPFAVQTFAAAAPA